MTDTEHAAKELLERHIIAAAAALVLAERSSNADNVLVTRGYSGTAHPLTDDEIERLHGLILMSKIRPAHSLQEALREVLRLYSQFHPNE